MRPYWPHRRTGYRNFNDFDDQDDPTPPYKRPLFWLAWGFIIATIIHYSFFAK